MTKSGCSFNSCEGLAHRQALLLNIVVAQISVNSADSKASVEEANTKDVITVHDAQHGNAGGLQDAAEEFHLHHLKAL